MNLRFRPEYVSVLIDGRVFGEVRCERGKFVFHFHAAASRLTTEQDTGLRAETTKYVDLLNITERLLK